MKKTLFKAYGIILGTLFRLIVRAVFRPRVHGAENIEDGAVIFAANHTTLADGPIIAAAMWHKRRPAVFITKKWYSRSALTPMFDYARCIPTDVDGRGANWLRYGLKALSEGGRTLLIFPEGHTNENDNVQEFHGGVALLGARSGAEIVPIYHTRPKAFHRTEIILGEPMRFPPGERVSGTAAREFSERLRQKVAELGKRVR